jgi:hypothetical protein
MTELKLENLVLVGVGVVKSNATGLVRLASMEAGERGAAILPSVERHLLSSQAVESDTRPRYGAISYGGRSAPRAGRLADSAGVPHSRIHPACAAWMAYLAVRPKSKSPMPLHSWQPANALRRLAGKGQDFDQPSTTSAFTRQRLTARHCPLGQQQARMLRVETAGHKPCGGR